MASVPELVFKVNVSDVVAVAPGARERDGVLVPAPIVTVTDPGETGPLPISAPRE
jgi:hypothetical protein